MGRKKKGPGGHTGKTDTGHTRDVKIERIDQVTIYKRGNTYSLYYREGGKTVRQSIDGNLAVARATATKVAAALRDNRPSPLRFDRTSPENMVTGFLDYVADVKKLAWRTQDRYRAALDRFLEFAAEMNLTTVDAMHETTVEDFIRWLRGQTRTRNGAEKGKQGGYKTGGIKFILCTCRTAFHWAARRRMLPAFSENPFSKFPIDQLRDPEAEDQRGHIFTPDQEQAFFQAASRWQTNLFLPLATYGLRVGELTHLLIEDVDFEQGLIHIRSKPDLCWKVKTSRRRVLPLTEEMRELFRGLIGSRKVGFVFLNEEFYLGGSQPTEQFASTKAFREWLTAVAEQVLIQNPEAGERDRRRAIVAFSRRMGQIPEKRVRNEFMKLTKAIGCPEFTRAHDLRHLFSSRAQEQGVNPLLVQEILGHASLEMTRRYTHLGLDAKRHAIESLKTSTTTARGDDGKTANSAE